MWIVLSVLFFSVIAYTFNETLLKILQQPLGEKLYYTSPTGGLSFVLKLSFLSGVIASLPVFVYHFFAFLAPLTRYNKRSTIALYTLWSFSLAYLGIAFAYYVSLPAALHFLGQFGDRSIQSIINANDYMNFVLAYLSGFAIIFQIPLIVLFLDRIRPLSVRKLMSLQRYVILISFIVAALLTPTPDPFNQAFMALPAIVLYQFAIILVWLRQRKRRTNDSSIYSSSLSP